MHTTISRKPKYTPPPKPIPRRYQPKVEALEFRVSAKEAEDELTHIANTHILRRSHAWGRYVKYHFLRSLGFYEKAGEGEDFVKLRRMSSLYLPIWIVDASFSIMCRGNDGRAEANCILTSSRMPGHSWKPMDSMPMYPPPPYDLNADKTDVTVQSILARNSWDCLTTVDYQPFDPVKHLEYEPGLVKEDVPEVIPFSISPLHLPGLIRKSLHHSLAKSQPDLSDGYTYMAGYRPGQNFNLTYKLPNGEVAQFPPLSFEPDSLKMDLMAAYPILMPIHVAEFSYADDKQAEQTITFVHGAWHSFAPQICYKDSLSDVWHWSMGRQSPLEVQRLDVFPRVPVTTDIGIMFDQHRQRMERERDAERRKRKRQLASEATEEAKMDAKRRWEQREREWEEEDKFHNRKLNENLDSYMLQSRRAEEPYMQEAERASLELLKSSNLSELEAVEEASYATRVAPKGTRATAARANAAEPAPSRWLANEEERKAEETHPDRSLGLGSFIHWTSAHVQRLSLNMAANRRYLQEGMPGMLHSRKRMVAIAAAGGDVDRISIRTSRGSEKGKQAVQTLQNADMDERIKRELLRPTWSKELQAPSKGPVR